MKPIFYDSQIFAGWGVSQTNLLIETGGRVFHIIAVYGVTFVTRVLLCVGVMFMGITFFVFVLTTGDGKIFY